MEINLFYLRILWIHLIHGICIIFSQNFEKGTIFCSIFPICGSFPIVYSQNFENSSLKGHLLLKSYIRQWGHRQNFPFGTTCQSSLFIVTCKSRDQAHLFVKFPKSSLFRSAVNHFIFRNSVSHDQTMKKAKFH